MELATAAASRPVDVTLRDGTTLRLRTPARAEADALVAFFAGLSERSRYQRLAPLTDVDAAELDLARVETW